MTPVAGVDRVGFFTDEELAALRQLLVQRAHARRIGEACARQLRRPVPETLLDRLAPIRTLNWPRPVPPAPWGWCWVRERDRHAVRLLPFWILGLMHLRYLHYRGIEVLCRLGLLELGEGDYYRNARPRGWATWWTPERRAGWYWVLTGERPP